MSNAIYEKLLSDAIAAVELGSVENFKSTWESDLIPFAEDYLGTSRFAMLAASRNCSGIVEYLMTKSDICDIGNIMANALDGYAKGGHSDEFMKLLDRLTPILKERDSHISLKDPIRHAIQDGHIDMARKLISILSVKPYAEFCKYRTNDETPYRSLLSVCLSENCVELLDELFEKCSVVKSEIQFDKILLMAKTLNYDAFVKKLEEWKEKYPYQPTPEKTQSKHALAIPGYHQLVALGNSLPWMVTTSN